MIHTKWPRLLVVGQPVTEERADEILIRTDQVFPLTNDKLWEKTVWDELARAGAPREPEHGSPERLGWYKRFADWRKSIGGLQLSYLDNWRIASSWIGGPHGWCDWDGAVGCSDFNIGKWPSTEEVTEDWVAIAEAFPYLDLTAQVVDDEGDGEVCGTWRVFGGRVEYADGPAEQIQPATEVTHFSPLFMGGERGVTIARLRRALARVADRKDGESR